MDTPQRTSQDVRDEWDRGVFDKPGTDKDRSRLLYELVAMHKDATACELVNALTDEGGRDMYVVQLIAELACFKGVERARQALISFREISHEARFAASLAIYAKSGVDCDLRALRTVVENMPSSLKAMAALTIYGQTLDTPDLVRAFQAMATPVKAPVKVKRYRDWRG